MNARVSFHQEPRGDTIVWRQDLTTMRGARQLVVL